MATSRLCAPPLLLLLSAIAASAGCSPQGDDYARPGTWAPTGVNEANLRAMLAEPAHAVRGAGAGTERARPGVLAIRRLDRDNRRALPNTNASRVGVPVGGAALAAPPTPAAEPGDGR